MLETPPTNDWYHELPRSVSGFATFGLLLMLVSLGGFGVWAFKAPLAAAVIAQGSFVATGSNKIIQHLEGGIINEILVGEGDLVAANQPLIHLDETAALARDRELMLRRARLEAMTARLLAQYREADDIDFSPVLTGRADDPEIAEVMGSQRRAFRVSRDRLAGDITLLESNIAALKIRAEGYETQHRSTLRQLEILREELQTKEHLRARGIVREPEANALRRAVADAEGQIGRLLAEIAEAHELIAKHEKQIAQTRNTHAQAALDEMQLIQVELDSVREQQRSAESVLRRAAIVAPVAGTIVRMYYHTPGGVIESGRPIAEILPSDAPLVIEAQVHRNEIDAVRAGQSATVRLIALNQRTTPVLEDKVFYVSADSVADGSQSARREIYIARVSLPPEELSRVRGFTPTPGMPAELLIETEARTFFDYLTRPITDSMSRAFREQ